MKKNELLHDAVNEIVMELKPDEFWRKFSALTQDSSILI